MEDDTKLPPPLRGFRRSVDGYEMTEEHIVMALDNIKAHREPHEGFPLGGLDRRASVATRLLRNEGVIKMGRKGWEIVKGGQ